MTLDDHPRLAEAHRHLHRAAEILEAEAPVCGTDTGRALVYIARIDALAAATSIENAARSEERGR